MVSHAIYDLDASKATGPDRIPAIDLKVCSPELSPVLAKLYNKNLAEFCFPSCGNLHRLCQFGERSDPGKYRPVSHLRIISKILQPLLIIV